jgi:hypothetical protein
MVVFFRLLEELFCIFYVGWVNTLCGGQSPGSKGFMFFKVDVDLTEEGQGW